MRHYHLGAPPLLAETNDHCLVGILDHIGNARACQISLRRVAGWDTFHLRLAERDLDLAA